MSIETARIEARCLVVSWSKNACKVAAFAARGGPHDPAASVVCDAGQKAVISAVADLVTAEPHQPVEAVLIELLSDDPAEDLPNRAPPDPQQPDDLRLVHLLRQPRAHVLEIARVLGPRPGPLQGLKETPAARAVKPSEPTLDHAPRRPKIEMPPALDAVLLDLKTARPAARAHRPLGSQRDRHDHPL